jgi:hypothetical protein
MKTAKSAWIDNVKRPNYKVSELMQQERQMNSTDTQI